MIWFICGVSGHILLVSGKFLFLSTYHQAYKYFCVDFQSSIYFPFSHFSASKLHLLHCHEALLDLPSKHYAKIPDTIFSFRLVSCSSNLLPFAHLCPPLAQIQHPCQTWNTFPSLAATTTCDRSFSFYRWCIFKNLLSRAVKALTVVMSLGVQMLNWDYFSTCYIWATNALQ